MLANEHLNHKANAKIFKALSDEKRLAILALLQHGEECSCVLLEQLDLTQSGLSYHMKILCESGIVIGRPEGKWTFYHISPEGRQKAVEVLLAATNIL
ncbi:ArsR/SmtB family transcription factor [Veillonella criceti]|uniref:Arsenical resistance operon repressor n=1 Tax=Veillonella criceti TaxID=103891 RepID=A0A380NJ08_9FIRM|nr:metalloregulator ArsR/SmtB family transcription factor [Veillonella criceti]SUP41528.1 Arsenical resistance operon repressor [Veillonella criceti]